MESFRTLFLYTEFLSVHGIPEDNRTPDTVCIAAQVCWKWVVCHTLYFPRIARTACAVSVSLDIRIRNRPEVRPSVTPTDFGTGDGLTLSDPSSASLTRHSSPLISSPFPCLCDQSVLPSGRVVSDHACVWLSIFRR